jgi:4-amino-4-deoxy-L-arabinose transferase-like glycosyltransferase
MDGELTAFRPPGYAIFLGSLYALAGPNPMIAYLAQAIVGSLTVLLVSALAWLLVSRRVALVAGFLAAVYPGLVLMPRVLLSENVSLPVLLAAACAGVKTVRTRSFLWAVFLGLLLGVAVMVHGSNLVFTGLLVPGYLVCAWREHKGVKGLVLSVATVAMLFMTLTPWTVRNYLLYDRFVPVGTEEGIALYSSYWPPRVGSKYIWGNVATPEDPFVAAAYNSHNEVDRSRALRDITFRRLRQNPSYFFQLIPTKLAYMVAPFDWEWFPHGANRSRSVNVGYILLLPPVMVAVFLLLRFPRRQMWVLWLLPTSVLILTVIFYGSPRFRLPAELFGLVVAPMGLFWLAAPLSKLISNRLIQPVRYSSPPTPGALLLAIAWLWWLREANW